MDKVITLSQAIAKIEDGMTVMVGGFLGNGSPHRLIDALVLKGIKNLTLICNDTAFEDVGVGKMIVAKQFKKAIVSHIGTNPETGRQMNAGEIEMELVPQGTLAERIRCAGTGLGGFYTPTGIGTEVEDGKEKKVIDGTQYLLEMPLKADVALVYATTVDKSGNMRYAYTQKNFNPMMAMAADLVLCEAEHIVETGAIDPNDVNTPGIFVNYIVGGDQ